MSKLKDNFLDIFFPRFCLGCGLEGTYLCQDCKEILEISQHKYCLCEIAPLRLPGAQKAGKCKKCSSKKLSGLYFPLSYKEKPLTKKLIHFFKYPPYYVKDLSGSLAELVANHLQLLEENEKTLFANCALVPIPMDRKKLKQRGYNQTEEITKELSKITGAMVFNNVLVKTKKTAPQMELAKEKRLENLKGCFTCRNKEKLTNKKIFLIDDVYTTGSTMEECARALKQAGARDVWGIAIARD